MTEVSKQYAEALFLLSAEEGTETETRDALVGIAQIFRENPDYLDFLSTPSIPKSERTEAIDKAFTGKTQENIVSFLKLLCERGYIGYYYECADEFDNLYNAAKGIKSASVVSAIPLTEDEKTALKAKLEALYKCSVTIDYSTDISLIGGIKIEIEGHIIDGSLKQRLHEIKEVIH